MKSIGWKGGGCRMNKKTPMFAQLTLRDESTRLCWRKGKQSKHRKNSASSKTSTKTTTTSVSVSEIAGGSRRAQTQNTIVRRARRKTTTPASSFDRRGPLSSPRTSLPRHVTSTFSRNAKAYSSSCSLHVTSRHVTASFFFLRVEQNSC